MSSFQLNQTTGDLEITNNSLALTTAREAIRQHLQCRFRLFLGEWFLDIDQGVPWFQDVLQKQSSFAVVKEILKTVILDTPGVIEITTFEFEYNGTTREATLTFSCLTEEGEIDFSLPIII